ncbi:TPA: hypothetical protein H1005_02675 [archaeon]|uniref:Uncharacterized protein n=1 Tax=Candidatus Naiadarchaeum limnaeum TaxID=2756139 RepID=A0A832VAB2_9ARCH|nr:hypothetical protein [Candidatus Naiadarchaeales archaeon SRR2090153.bin1042]HIK00466.1 hypothetical protein [Candidatus Naiadarchaeum limnaeum]
MAKKSESEKAMPAMKLPMDPKMLGAIVVVIIIVAAVFMMRGPSNGPETGGTTTGGDEPLAPPSPPAPEQPAATYGCTTNIQCDDKDRCTTDSCSAGVCKNTPEPDCAVSTEQQPKIVAVNFGSKEDEFVQIEGKNWYVDNWVITNGKGEVLIKFFQTYTTENKINGKWTIYTSCASLSTSTIKYVCKDKGFFSDTGDKAILKDEVGNVISEMAG